MICVSSTIMSHNYSFIHDYLSLPIDQKSIAVGAAAADDYRMSIRITKSDKPLVSCSLVPVSVYSSVVILP